MRNRHSSKLPYKRLCDADGLEGAPLDVVEVLREVGVEVGLLAEVVQELCEVLLQVEPVHWVGPSIRVLLVVVLVLRVEICELQVDPACKVHGRGCKVVPGRC